MTFASDLSHYINLSHATAWNKAKASGYAAPDEPGCVSSFLSAKLVRRLRSIIMTHTAPGAKVLCRGIFTHQTPKVKLTGQNAVEIGDLMFIHKHVSTNPQIPDSGRALLLQAKKTLKSKTGSLASGNQAVQFELYRDWAPFKGTSRLPIGPVGSPHWDFQAMAGPNPGTTAADSSGYLTIFKEEAYLIPFVTPGPSFLRLLAHYPNSCSWSSGSSPAIGTSAIRGVDCPNDFGTALETFLCGGSGRVFTPGTLVGPDHWSIFVNTMLWESSRANGNYLYNDVKQGVLSGMRGRNLRLMSSALAIGHSIAQMYEDAMYGLPPDSRDYTVLHDLTRILRDNSDRPPIVEELSEFSGPVGGHVPLLLVITIGNDGNPFLAVKR